MEFLVSFLEGLTFVNEFAELPILSHGGVLSLNNHQVLLKDTIKMEEEENANNKHCSHLDHVRICPGYTY
jgi:hypothetical protein